MTKVAVAVYCFGSRVQAATATAAASATVTVANFQRVRRYSRYSMGSNESAMFVAVFLGVRGAVLRFICSWPRH